MSPPRLSAGIPALSNFFEVYGFQHWLQDSGTSFARAPVSLASHPLGNWEEGSNALSFESRIAKPERQSPLPISGSRFSKLPLSPHWSRDPWAELLRKLPYHRSGDTLAQLSKLTGQGRRRRS